MALFWVRAWPTGCNAHDIHAYAYAHAHDMHSHAYDMHSHAHDIHSPPNSDSKGELVVWQLETRRPRWTWKGHQDAILNVRLWPTTTGHDGPTRTTTTAFTVLRYTHAYGCCGTYHGTGSPTTAPRPSQGRDHRLCVWSLTSCNDDDTPVVTPSCDVPVGSVTFCRCDYLDDLQGLVAVPGATRPETVDVWHVERKRWLFHGIDAPTTLGQAKQTRRGTV